MGDEGAVRKQDRSLVVTFFILIALAIVLLVAIFLIKMWNQDNGDVSLNSLLREYSAGAANNPTIAELLDEDIVAKYNNGTYSYDEAVLEYKKAFEEAKGSLKTYIAMNQADFMYKEKKDATNALNLLKTVEEPDDDGSAVISYYNAMVFFADLAKDKETAKKYRLLLSETNEGMNKVSPDAVYDVMGGRK